MVISSGRIQYDIEKFHGRIDSDAGVVLTASLILLLIVLCLRYAELRGLRRCLYAVRVRCFLVKCCACVDSHETVQNAKEKDFQLH